MKYMLLMYANESDAQKAIQAEDSKAVVEAWQGLTKDATSAGVLVTSSGLAPIANATTLRVRDGKNLVTDGPFAETHEQLGGYLLLDCKDLDEALRWAARIPTVKYGSIEIRPIWGQ